MNDLSEHDLDLLEAFWDGSLPEPEQQALKNRLASDAAFRKSADQLHAAMLGLQSLHEHRMRQWMKQLDAAESVPELAPKSRPWSWLKSSAVRRSAAAAAILLSIGIGWQISRMSQSTTGAQAVAQVFEPYPGVGVDLSPGGEATKYRAFEAYQAGRYAEAAPLFAAYAEATNDPLSRFYQGISHLGAHQSQQAIDVLANLRTVPDVPTEAVNWYLALAYVAAQQPESARPILLELQQKDGDYARKADGFLAELAGKKIL
jgi:hypothetical protein